MLGENERRPKGDAFDRIIFFFFSIYLLIITLNNYSYNTTEKKNKTKQNTLTIDINRVKQD